MHNAKLDFGEIFALKSQRKNNKFKTQGIKYLDRPFPSIKPVKQIIFNLRGSRFALLTEKQIFVFDNFTKQNMYSVNIEEFQFLKILFFKEDMVAINEDNGIYYFHEEANNAKFKPHLRKAEIDETGFSDVENIEDNSIVLVGNIYLHLVTFVISKDQRVHAEVRAQNETIVKKIKFLKTNPEKTEFLFLDYTDPSNMRFLIFGPNLHPLRQILVFPFKPQKQPRPVSEKMDVEIIEEEEESEEQIHFPTSIDTLIYVPQIEKVIIVDLTNGLFVIETTENSSAILKPYFELDNYDKIKLRCVCLCTDYSRKPILCMFSMRQTHQHVHFKPLTHSSETELFSEISESRIKAKKVYFNSLWNSFMIIDYDDNYYLMEFFNHNYYEKYWIRFKAIDENVAYQEEETEFDQPTESTNALSRAQMDAELMDLVNGRR